MTDTVTDTEQAVLALLDDHNRSLDELVTEIDEPRADVEASIRRLLQRHLIGETADWKFYLSVHGEQHL